MSRVIVKNLPNGIKEEQLKKLFGEKGTVTDCALKFTKDGVFRKFAFIGFQTSTEAEATVKHFDKTFVRTSRIQVELAKDLGDPSKPRAWSKHSVESSTVQKKEQALKEDGKEKKQKKEDKKAKKKKAREEKLTEMLGDLKDDPGFTEFLEAHKPKGSKATWVNDDASAQKQESDKSDAEHAESASSESDEEGEKEVAEKEVTKKQEKTKRVTDLDYLKSKKTASKTVDSSEEESDSDEDSDSDGDENLADAADDNKSKTQGEQKKQQEHTEEKAPAKEPESYKVEHRTKYLIKMRGLAANVNQKQIKEFFKPIPLKEIKIPKFTKGKQYCIVTVEFSSEKEQDQAMAKNKNYIGQKKIFLHKLKVDVKESASNEMKSWQKQETDTQAEEIGETGRLYVRNLAYICKEDDLEKLFSRYGPLTEVHLPIDSLTKKIKGFAFISFMLPEHAVKAFAELDGTVFQGRMLHILPGKEKKGESDDINESSSFKKKREAKEKASAGSSHNWNALFLGANAVADVMAEKYNSSKSEILNPDAKASLGVRMALGETQIVSETRDFLLEQGVALDSFSQAAAERSKTVILVKNLPAGTKVDDLRKVFSKYGTLGRLVLPPAGITAIVEYLEPTEARNGFRNLAYTKFQHLPLYLEWAPMGVFKEPPPGEPNKETISEETAEAQKESEDEDEGSSSSDEGKDEEGSKPDCTLFVKNLNFDTAEDSLKQVFAKCGKIKHVVIAKKKDLKNPGNMLSMGYGFVEFQRSESAKKALKQLQHTKLDEHMLELKLSNRATVQKVTVKKKKQDESKKQTSSKILVRNLPFQATVKEVKELFRVFGELKTVRLPKKMTGTGTHRGFGFVDFLTKQDAKRAFNSLCHSTHLYGRRLVLEWADAEDSVEQVRKRTADHFIHDVPQKKLKKSAITNQLKGGEEPR